MEPLGTSKNPPPLSRRRISGKGRGRGFTRRFSISTFLLRLRSRRYLDCLKLNVKMSLKLLELMVFFWRSQTRAYSLIVINWCYRRQIPMDELVPLVCGDLDSNFYQDNDGSESSQALADDLEPRKLTRAQRKRLRKRKLKETASVGRKIIGPSLPSNVQYVDEPSKRSLRQNVCEPE